MKFGHCTNLKRHLNQFFAFQLQPDLRELYDTMSRLTLIPSNFEGKTKVQEWLNSFASMAASDELSDNQVRQIIFDMESSYNAFNRLLHEP